MDIFQNLFDTIKPIFPTAIAVVSIIIVLYIVRLFLNRQQDKIQDNQFRRQMIILLLSLTGTAVIILVLPVSETLRGQLLSLFGILLTAAIALSSTTLVGNAMAGLMLRAVRSFRPGDFISVRDYFGRVSERGLFHVEIQTEYRDLITIPNLFLVTNPVQVIRSSGTIITAEVSLGYDIAHHTIETNLLQAAQDTGLEEPFVHIIKLGDFSVTYRVAGLLKEVKQLLSTRSRLKAMILDKMNENGIEIVSPTFMNTRAIPEYKKFIPDNIGSSNAPEQTPAEEIAFDKADQAESIEKLREMYNNIGNEIKTIEEEIDKADGKAQRQFLKEKKERLLKRREYIAELIKSREKDESAD